MLYYYVLLTSFVLLSSAQELTTVLAQHPSVSQFSSFLQRYPDLVSQLNAGIFTIFAPTNDAFAVFEQKSNATSVEDALLALLQYHIIHNTHPSATFSHEPFFPSTLLANASYTNVTGGQRVECTSVHGKPTVLSGVKAASSITGTDLLFVGGLIQVIDSVLTIPLTGPATWTAAGLTDLIAVLNKGGWLTNPVTTQIGLYSSDMTSFLPNSPEYGASYTGLEGLDNDDLESLFYYAYVGGETLYTSDLKNNTRFQTPQGKYITITHLDNDIYVDASKIIGRDYLTTNGVLQVLDSPLNPNTSDARPIPSTIPIPHPRQVTGLSNGAKAGIAIAVIAIFLILLLAGLWTWRQRRRRQALQEHKTSTSSTLSQLDSREVFREQPKYELDTTYERMRAAELGEHRDRSELDSGQTWGNRDVMSREKEET